MNGKGSARRPEDRAKVAREWERIFGPPSWDDAVAKAIADRMRKDLDEALRRMRLPHELW